MKKYILLFVGLIILSFLAGCTQQQEKSEVPTITVGYLPTDHQAALFVAADYPDLFKDKYGIYLKKVKDKEEYELYKGDKKIANIKLILIKQGGAAIMNLMNQKKVDVALLGVPPAIFYIDKGTNAKIVMNLHTDGSAVVVRKDIPVNNWEEFVNWIKEQHKEGKQVKIGHPLPTSIQYVMIKDALKASGITYTENPQNKSAMVLLINCKGQGSMPQLLESKQLDAVIAWEPMPEILRVRGIGKPIVYSQDLPSTTGKTWKNHPCCCVCVSEDSLSKYHTAIITFCKLLKDATIEIQHNETLAIDASSRWLGTSKEIEKLSVPHITYDYRLEPIVPKVIQFVEVMNEQGLMKGRLKDANPDKIKEIVFDWKAYNEIVK
ncbi:ABC transporter substrate-binding protein [Methanocaldococcus indicus]|uniref:ABC transporter substrate-binding protein n=1 Tax=Methanocaldococcus indicus TaxID=213231 RepID=UPI003C6D7C15